MRRKEDQSISTTTEDTTPEGAPGSKKRGRPFGYRHTSETIAKMKASKTSEAQINRLAKLHEGNKGKKRSHEQRMRMSDAHRGHTHTDQSKQKMSKIHTEIWRRRKENKANIIFADPETQE